MKYVFFFLLSLILSYQNNSTKFTFNVYNELIRNNSEINIMFSPYSLRIALSILLEG